MSKTGVPFEPSVADATNSTIMGLEAGPLLPTRVSGKLTEPRNSPGVVGGRGVPAQTGEQKAVSADVAGEGRYGAVHWVAVEPGRRDVRPLIRRGVGPIGFDGKRADGVVNLGRYGRDGLRDDGGRTIGVDGESSTAGRGGVGVVVDLALPERRVRGIAVAATAGLAAGREWLGDRAKASRDVQRHPQVDQFMRDGGERAAGSDDAGRSDAEPDASFQAELRMSDKTLAVLRVDLDFEKGRPWRAEIRGRDELHGDDPGDRTVAAADERKRKAHRTDDFFRLGRQGGAREVVVHEIQLGVGSRVVPRQTGKEQAVGVGIADKGGIGARRRITDEPGRRDVRPLIRRGVSAVRFDGESADGILYLRLNRRSGQAEESDTCDRGEAGGPN